MSEPTFRRRPPFLARVFFGLGVYGLFLPLMWILERLGRADRFLRALSAKQRQRFDKVNPFDGYVPGTQDVFIAVAAKHGTNWMMQIAYQLIHHGHGDFEHIHCVVPWPEMEVGPAPMRGYAVPLAQADDWTTAPERKRVIKTHMPWERLPYSREARYICVIRDPKDVFVSSYHFVKGVAFGPAMPSVDTWFRLFLSNSMMGERSWAEMVAGYWAQRHRPNVLVMSFKEMKRDLRATVRTVADFLDIHVTEDVIDLVCEKSSFAYMKQVDHKFRPWRLAPWAPPPTMIRAGAQGGAAELLSVEQRQQMDAHFIAELQRLGSDLPYDRFADITTGVNTKTLPLSAAAV